MRRWKSEVNVQWSMFSGQLLKEVPSGATPDGRMQEGYEVGSGVTPDQTRYQRGTQGRYALYLGIILLLATQLLQAQPQIPRSVMGCGGNVGTSASYRMNGTVSQSAIGKMVVASAQNHNAGFWHTVQNMFLGNRYAALVVIPGSNATPGERVKIPLLLEQSKNLNISSAKNFTATLRFNATLLEPTDKSNYTRTNDTGWVKVSGSVQSSTGILAEVEFLAKLGNNETTPVSIESFVFTETSLVRIARKDGIFSLDGVCREGGQVRLTKSVKATALAMFPNPVVHNATIEANLTERGTTEIYLMDLRGVKVDTFYQGEAVPGVVQLRVNASDIPSGGYFLMMRTPNELFSQQVIVEK